MKAALVSATSLAALLAFEVGLDVAIDARPAKAATGPFTAENPLLNFGYVLLNTTATLATLTETVTNSAFSGITVTFPAVGTSPFSGTSVADAVNGRSTGTHPYTLSLPSGATIGTTYSLQSTLSSGTNLQTVTLTAEAVGPKAATVSNSTIYGRVGGGAQTIAAITVSNIGNGDLYSNTTASAQLQGSIGAISGSVFTRSGSTTTFSLNDSNYTGSGTATTSATFNYIFNPTTRGAVGTGSVNISLTNGNPNGTNTSVVVPVTLTGQGVGPTFESNIKGSVFSNSTNIGHNTIAAGTISMGSAKPGATIATTITLSNISTDPGSASLTNLTLESATLSGPNASDFSVIGFTTGMVLGEAQSVTVMLDFSGPTAGNYDADLSFSTDEGATLGGSGAVFTYLIDPWVVTEPATVLTFGMGLVGLGWARRKRAARRSVTGTHTLAI